MHEVGPGPVPQRVYPVHMAVRRIRETVDIQEGVARLGVLHLGPFDQHQAVLHTALLKGLVGLGDHQVDHCLDRGGPARRRARGRCIEDGDVDRDIGSDLA